ncbi:hypothetical protein N2152v2_004657 [Parachlorella kessleri]
MLARRLAGEVPVLCSLGVRSLASKGAEAAQGAKPTEGADAKAVAAAAESLGALVKEGTPFPVPTTIPGGQAYPSDMRSVSGLGIGDGIANHTRKWMQGNHKTPMEYIQQSEPIKVHGLVVASYGSEDPALGAPVEYINLKGTTYDNPAVCKYTGNKFYSDDWKGGGGH